MTKRPLPEEDTFLDDVHDIKDRIRNQAPFRILKTLCGDLVDETDDELGRGNLLDLLFEKEGGKLRIEIPHYFRISLFTFYDGHLHVSWNVDDPNDESFKTDEYGDVDWEPPNLTRETLRSVWEILLAGTKIRDTPFGRLIVQMDKLIMSDKNMYLATPM